MNDKYRKGIVWAIGALLIATFFTGGLWYLFNDNSGVSFVMFAATLLSVSTLSIWHDDGMGNYKQD